MNLFVFTFCFIYLVGTAGSLVLANIRKPCDDGLFAFLATNLFCLLMGLGYLILHWH